MRRPPGAGAGRDVGVVRLQFREIAGRHVPVGPVQNSHDHDHDRHVPAGRGRGVPAVRDGDRVQELHWRGFAVRAEARAVRTRRDSRRRTLPAPAVRRRRRRRRRLRAGCAAGERVQAVPVRPAPVRRRDSAVLRADVRAKLEPVRHGVPIRPPVLRAVPGVPVDQRTHVRAENPNDRREPLPVGAETGRDSGRAGDVAAVLVHDGLLRRAAQVATPGRQRRGRRTKRAVRVPVDGVAVRVVCDVAVRHLRGRDVHEEPDENKLPALRMALPVFVQVFHYRADHALHDVPGKFMQLKRFFSKLFTHCRKIKTRPINLRD